MSSYNAYDDGRLVQLLMQGDKAAFTELYERYWDILLGIAYNRLKDLKQAEDIVHDVYVSLWNKRDHLQIHSFQHWMATAVKYMTLRAASREMLQHRYTTSQQQLPGADIAENLADKQLREMLTREINRLPEKCRIIFSLKQQGFSNGEIADEMDITIKTVENQINRGIRILKKGMTDNLLSILFL